MKFVDDTSRRVDAFQQRHNALAFVIGVVKKYGDDNAGNLVVQLTYAMFVTVFPLLLLLVTLLSIVLASDPADRLRVLHSALGEFPIVGQQLGHNIHALDRTSTFGLIVGAVGLLYGSTGLAQAGLFSMEQVWNIPAADRPGYVVRLFRSLTFLVVLTVGLIATTLLAGFGTFGQHRIWIGVVGEILAVVINITLYLAAFRTLTPRQVPTRALVPGVFLGGVAWTILQAAGSYVVGHDLKGSSALYGLFGLVLGLMAWIYLGAQVTIYVAEVNSVLHEHLWPRGLVHPPLSDADQRSYELQVTENQQRPEQEVSSRFDARATSQDEYRNRGERT
jgi:YihY family inner membrane protein